MLASPGRPLEPVLRQDMEQRFGYDFSHVRVHSNVAAEQSALDVNAKAYTMGHDIVFATGQFAPGTYLGRRLIAHELTHVVQQSGAPGISLDPGAERRGLSRSRDAHHRMGVHPFSSSSSAGRTEKPETRFLPLWSAIHTPALQRQEAGLEPSVGNSSGLTDAEDSAGQAGFWDWIFGKDRRVECAHELGKCNLTCRRFTSQSQAYERCMTCCKTGYDICLDVGGFVTPEGGCARG